MKKFITRVAAILAGLAISLGVSAQNLTLAKNAPDSYVVVKGDTLWDISGRFLNEPWRWPEIWDINRDAIKDPHWIYPGDIIYLDLSGDQPRLRLGKRIGGNRNNGDSANGRRAQLGKGAGFGSLKPRIRRLPLDAGAIPTLNMAAIEAFLNRPIVIEPEELKKNPRIFATQEGRVYLGRGDLAYVRGDIDESISDWHIFRQSRPLLDPDTRKPIAYEALYVGSARLERGGDPVSMRIFNTSEEVGVGDRLMPAKRAEVVNIAPHAPAKEVNGRIVSVYRGVSQVGKNSVIAINLGKQHGMEVGHVLSIRQLGRTTQDRETKEWIKLPDEAVGYMIVFRVFKKIAYGLVMEASQSITVGDTLTRP